jgi:hypothetical protein
VTSPVGPPSARDEAWADLAAAAAIAAALAVAAALTAQVLTITRRLNPANLADVKAWYRRQFELRAYPAQAATVVLLLPAAQTVVVAAADPHQTCQATLGPAQLQPVLTCHDH